MSTTLFTPEIEARLQEQFAYGSNLDQQHALCKIFDSQGVGIWYLLNQDPKDPNMLYCIGTNGEEHKIGNIKKSELEDLVLNQSIRLERDLSYLPKPANELYSQMLNS